LFGFKAGDRFATKNPLLAQVVYDILLNYLGSPEKHKWTMVKFIDRSFVIQMVQLFQSGDSRERRYLKAVLHEVHSNIKIHRPLIYDEIKKVFREFVFVTKLHRGIAELLEVVTCIISSQEQLSEELKVCFRS
jgi:Protein phosphatase 2A regulatory B subunit (B56 family)